MAGLVRRSQRQRPQFHDLTVLEVSRLTATAVAITLEVPEPLAPTFAFRAGQHLTLRTVLNGTEVRRSYSCCISPQQARASGVVRVASAQVPGGAMSTWLNTEVEAGDRLSVLPAMGDFTCPTVPGAARHHCAVAGGSGITPVLSLLSTALEEEPASSASLIFSNRDEASVMFAAELRDLEHRYTGRFRVRHVLTRASAAVPGGLAGRRLTPGLLGKLLSELEDAAGTVQEWYLCGPQGLVDMARQVALGSGTDPTHVHHEVFHPEPLPPDAG